MKKDKKYILISSGRGPAECCWVVAQVLKKMKKEFEAQNLAVKILERTIGPEHGTLHSALISVEGNNISSTTPQWIGPILWIGKSTFRKLHKRKNWFVAVSELEPPTKIDLQNKDIKYTTFRASGPGGQHRNKVETAVRCTHTQTKISATASEAKSQSQNKKIAYQKLIGLINDYAIEQQKKAAQTQWKSHTEIQRGSPAKTFTGPKFELKT